jgi:integrase
VQQCQRPDRPDRGQAPVLICHCVTMVYFPLARVIGADPAEVFMELARMPTVAASAWWDASVTSGMRVSEATALGAADIDAEAKMRRINKAWKYSGDYCPQIGPPKTKQSIRTISLRDARAGSCRLNYPWFLFTNGAGNPVRAQEFFDGGWKPGRDSAIRAVDAVAARARPSAHLRVVDDPSRRFFACHSAAFRPRVHSDHDWRLGHLDRRSARVAADAVGSALA